MLWFWGALQHFGEGILTHLHGASDCCLAWWRFIGAQKGAITSEDRVGVSKQNPQVPPHGNGFTWWLVGLRFAALQV